MALKQKPAPGKGATFRLEFRESMTSTWLAAIRDDGEELNIIPLAKTTQNRNLIERLCAFGVEMGADHGH